MIIVETDRFQVKLAQTNDEKRAAQRLRYRVFVEEMGAKPSDLASKSRLEGDEFDPFFDHLILIDLSIKDKMNSVIGVYRLMTHENAKKGVGFYSAPEFDLHKLETSGRNILELGRSCVLAEYRGGLALNLLWNGLAMYVKEHQVDILFGAASFNGTDVPKFESSLSFLHHNHLAPEELCVIAKGQNAITMNILEKTQIDKLMAVRQLPPLIKAYIRLGGYVGYDAYIDYQFNTIDVCLIMDTARLSQKHINFYNKEVR